MSKARNTGNLNNSIQISDTGNITFVSGSTTLLAISSSGAVTTTGVISGSNALSASFAATASSADNFLARGTITAQTLVVQTITSSVDFVTGSTQFGSKNTDIHTYTGSLAISGSSTVGLNVNAGALYVSASGNTGIGTTNPGTALDVVGIGRFSSTLNASRGIFSGDFLQNETSKVGIGFASGYTQINSWGADTSTFGGIKFQLSVSNGNTQTPLIILPSGYVGIGTTNPVALLHLRGSGTSGQVTATQIWENLNSGTLGLEISGSAGSSYAVFKYGGGPGTGTAGLTQAMAIVLEGAGAGRVGIGTTNPSAKLDVSGSVTVSGSLSIYGDGAFINRLSSGEPYIFFRKDGVNRGSIYGVDGGGIRIFDNNDVQVLTVTSSFVGIGTSTPSNRLTVHQGGGVRVTGITNGSYIELSGDLPGYSANAYPVIKSNGTIHFANNGKYAAYLEGADTYFGIMNNAGVTKINLATNGATFFTGGSVGIGTTNPSALLDIQGTAESLYLLRVPGASPHLRLRGANGTVSALTTSANGNRVGQVSFEPYVSSGLFLEMTGIFGVVNGTVTSTAAPTDLVFAAGSSGNIASNERMRITSGGNVGIGLNNPLATLATLGGAVQIMGDYRNHATIIKSAGANGTFNGSLVITIPEMSNANVDGYGGYSCEVYLSAYPGHYCHVWFSGYINGGITSGEATILRSNGGYSVSQSSYGTYSQGFQFTIDYPNTFIHPTARIIFNKGGSPNATAYPANSITATFS